MQFVYYFNADKIQFKKSSCCANFSRSLKKHLPPLEKEAISCLQKIKKNINLELFKNMKKPASDGTDFTTNIPQQQNFFLIKTLIPYYRNHQAKKIIQQLS